MAVSCKEMALSEEYYDIITDFPVKEEAPELYDLCMVPIEDQYRILYVNRRELENTGAYFFEPRSVPKLYGLMEESFVPGERPFDTNHLTASGILQVQREPLALTGRGCVIVIIDTGIDYTNPLFRRPDGSSRILALWDQTVQNGMPPAGIPYGSEYSRVELNRALQAENPYDIVPSRDTNGHGTNLAAVAAGSRLEESGYVGAAPEADLVIVKLKECKEYLRDFYLVPRDVPAYAENDIMLGAFYGERFARNFVRPVVICLGLGTNYGDHAGNSALSQYLNRLAVRRSRAAVVCGGNEGNEAHHYQGKLSSGRAGIPEETVEIRVGENCAGFLLEFWGDIPDVFAVSVRSPGGEAIPPVRLGLKDVITYSFIYERTRIMVAGNQVEAGSGDEVILFRVEKPTPGIWTFRVEAVGEIHNGNFHFWLPLRQFLNTDVFFLESTPYTTLTEPAMADGVITVSAYNSANNSFSIFSGRGYSRTGTVTPDLAAPGVNIPVVRGTATGSSLAAAITAGAAAQFMQWAVVEGNNNVVESREIRSYLIRGASRMYDLNYPNREWGYGRLNLQGTFNAMVGV